MLLCYDLKTILSPTENVNFLIANGKMFAHPLQHLDKTLDDLPVIAIDSFRHMYVFPDFNDIYKPGKLTKFVADLHSGKLHREFHYGPDVKGEDKDKDKDKEEVKEKIEEESKPEALSTAEDEQHSDELPSKPKSQPSENEIGDETEESPRDSTFIKLAPSDKRYTLLRNEL